MKAIHAIKLVGGALIVAVSVGAWAQASDTGMASAPGMSQPSPKKAARQANRALVKKVRAALKQAKVDETEIEIKAHGSAVSLSGSVADASQSQAAEQAAKSVEGVSSVKNELSVKEKGQ
jgi:hyperosmotically inducible periplasmic protein